MKQDLKFRTLIADATPLAWHTCGMARRGVPKGPVNWYLREWMEACGLQGRGAQAKMMKLTGWSKATMSQLYNGDQDYSPKVVNDAALALNVRTYELLMPPEEAMALRGLRANALTIAAEAQRTINAIPNDTTKADGTNG